MDLHPDDDDDDDDDDFESLIDGHHILPWVLAH